jgi:hypothetical protein
MEPEGSLLCSEEPAICPCYKPDESNPVFPSYFIASLILTWP